MDLRTTWLILLLVWGALQSETSWASEQAVRMKLRPMAVERAVKYVARKFGKSVLFQAASITSIRTNRLSGLYTSQQALDALLNGTSLVGDLTKSGVIVIAKNPDYEKASREKTMKISKQSHLTAGISLGALMMSGAAGAADDASSAGFEEIIVTADKRSESVQDVPISIAAFSADAMRNRGLTKTFDLEDKTLGLNLALLQSEPTIAIRGVGTTISGINSDPSVAMYNEGIYQARPVLFRVGFYDLERVEVLKGPQGTLYGRNSTGGVINVISKNPDLEEFGGYATLAYGSFNLMSADAAVNIPFDGGAFRVAGLMTKDDGYTENLAQEGELDHQDVRAFRAKLLLEPSEDLSVLFAAEYVNDQGTPGAGYVNSSAIDPNTGVDLSDPDNQMYRAFDNAADPRHVNLNGELYSDREILQLTSTISYDLGSVTLKSITGYVDLDYIDATDTDGTAAPIEQSYNSGTSKSFSQELQLSGNDTSAIDWIAGLYYFNEDSDSNSYFGFSTVPFGGADLFESDSLNEAKTNSYGVFANVGYNFSDELKLTLGARYTHEKKSFDQTDNVTGVAEELSSESFGDFSPKAVLEWTPNENTLAYASITKGFKSGGLTFAVLGVPAKSFDPEELWAYEIGAKTTLADGRMQLNAAAFYYDFNNYQYDGLVQDPDTGLLIQSIGNANTTIKGFEVEAKAQVTERLRLDAGVAYTRGLMPKNAYDSATFPDDFQLPLLPEWRSNVGLEYSVPTDKGRFTARADMTYQSSMLFTAFQNPPFEQSGGYSLFDVGMVYENDDDGWALSAVIKNIADKEVLAIRGDFSPFNVLELYAPPRTWEVRLTVNY